MNSEVIELNKDGRRVFTSCHCCSLHIAHLNHELASDGPTLSSCFLCFLCLKCLVLSVSRGCGSPAHLIPSHQVWSSPQPVSCLALFSTLNSVVPHLPGSKNRAAVTPRVKHRISLSFQSVGTLPPAPPISSMYKTLLSLSVCFWVQQTSQILMNIWTDVSVTRTTWKKPL